MNKEQTQRIETMKQAITNLYIKVMRQSFETWAEVYGKSIAWKLLDRELNKESRL